MGGGLGIRIPIELREYAVSLYISGYSRTDIANEIGCGKAKVKDILLEYGISPDFERNTPVSIIMYNKYFNIQKIFNSKNEAYYYILNNENPKCNKEGFYGHIKKSFQTGCIRYGHRWQLASDLVYEDKVFRTKFDKEAYIQGKPAYQPEGKKYYIVDDVLDNIIKEKIEINKEEHIITTKCSICGKVISSKSLTGMCNSCANVVAKGKSPKPSREQLLIDAQTMNKKQIALKYGRTKSTISYWFKQYGI